MRGIALKIFLSFWFISAVLTASSAVLFDRRSTFRFADHVRQHGLVASAILERQGAGSCAEFGVVVEQQTLIQFVLFDRQRAVVCHSPGADLAVYRSHLRDPDDIVEAATDGALVFVPIRSPSGAPLIAAGSPMPGFDAVPPRPPFPYGPVGLAIVVSGIVCFAVARYLARPLQRVRDASYRLAAGDLQARVGPSVGVRRDEIGDLVRDFDAMAARIETLVHSQGQLLSDISHELRSPLARLNVALELARRKAGPAAHVDLDRIETEADRMNDLIGRVLTLARAESNPASEAAVPLDLSDLVRQVTDDADYEAQQQHKSVTLRFAATPTVAGDAQLIASAVENVLRNAVHYTPERTTVEVVVDGTDRETVIAIRDHGPGVPQADLERIFSPFHRVESARNRDAGGIGVGLGLAIARRAIAVHGGRIGAENVADGGLRVTIRIPVDASATSL